MSYNIVLAVKNSKFRLMRVRILIASLFSVFIFSFSDCGNKCFGEYCSDIINFKLIDQNTQNDLVLGAPPKYKLDSLQLNKAVDFNLGKHSNFIGIVSAGGDRLQVSPYVPRETLYLRLSYDDIDTINIQYQYVENDCCESVNGYGRIQSVSYNGQTAEKVGGNYIFLKK